MTPEELLELIRQGWKLPKTGVDINETLYQFERILLQKAIEASYWNIALAARKLKMKRSNLSEKLKTYEIYRPKVKPPKTRKALLYPDYEW